MAIESSTLMRLLASIDPRLWEVLFPPQPPWVGKGHGTIHDPWNDVQLQVQIATRDVARRIVEAAAAVRAQGGDGAAVIKRSVDEWVHVDDGDGTGTIPRFFPAPWPYDPPRPPRPNELVDLAPAFAAAAWSFSVIGATVRDPSLQQAIGAAVDTIVDAAASLQR
ncbi:hypothetical protein FHT40_005764 [Mycolicibacterium sp. BK556]|uniref:hypothetical protein n=1 Tax=unclassified Mycolicibacterium TaxID=2636767 RepID=UPI00181863D8|nr:MULTISPECIES: hypothetical protein [unclassified Mycolicibacterium]MBB3606075.1 hypothetical protein [Mycolicibacterium sp. BK556]MBB3632652.1 hypothetical protein [Mycolicibacterium sp. BK607]